MINKYKNYTEKTNSIFDFVDITRMCNYFIYLMGIQFLDFPEDADLNYKINMIFNEYVITPAAPGSSGIFYHFSTICVVNSHVFFKTFAKILDLTGINLYETNLFNTTLKEFKKLSEIIRHANTNYFTEINLFDNRNLEYRIVVNKIIMKCCEQNYMFNSYIQLNNI